MNAKDLIINALVDLYQNGPRGPLFGLCTHIDAFRWSETNLKQVDEDRMFGAVRDLRDDLFCRWPLRSGDFDYPVPGPKGKAPAVAFHSTTDRWTGEYGAMRWALAEFMLRELCK